MSILDKFSSGATHAEVTPSARRSVDVVRSAVKRRLAARSLVTRDPESLIWLRRFIFRRKPVLYHLEMRLTDHCNLDCKGCPSLATLCEPALADLAEFEADMERVAAIFSGIREIHLIGGDPLLHPKVTEFCRATRKAFPKSRIYLRTNGTLVMGVDDAFWDALAETRTTLLVDVYPVNIPALEIELMGKQRKVKVELVRQEDELVKLPIDPRGGHDAIDSFRQCQGFYNRPLLRDGRLYPCTYVAFADVFRARFGIKSLQVYPTDWISIREDHTPEEIFAFLRNPVHWCSNCDMPNCTQYDWDHTGRHISEWTTAPAPARPRPQEAEHADGSGR